MKPTFAGLPSSVLGLALLVVPLPAMAQSTLVQGFASDLTGFGTCAANATTCTWVSLDGLSTSYGEGHATVGGPLGVAATVTTNGLVGGGQYASGLAAFTDVYTLSNVPTGGTAQFSMHLTGDASVPAGSCYTAGTQRHGVVLTPAAAVGPSPCSVRARSNLYLWLDYDYGPSAPLLNTTGFSVYDFIPQPFNSNFTNFLGSYDDIFTVTVPVVNGIFPVRFLMFANAALFQSATVPPPGGFSGTARSDFLSTATLTSIQFFDSNGLDVSSQVGFASASGANYQIGLPETATVPEPGTMALVATGLAVLAGRARRKKAS